MVRDPLGGHLLSSARGVNITHPLSSSSRVSILWPPSCQAFARPLPGARWRPQEGRGEFAGSMSPSLGRQSASAPSVRTHCVLGSTAYSFPQKGERGKLTQKGERNGSSWAHEKLRRRGRRSRTHRGEPLNTARPRPWQEGGVGAVPTPTGVRGQRLRALFAPLVDTVRIPANGYLHSGGPLRQF